MFITVKASGGTLGGTLGQGAPKKICWDAGWGRRGCGAAKKVVPVLRGVQNVP